MQNLFVYGTLRPGGSNHHLLGHVTVAEQAAVADGLALYTNDTSSYPYAAATTGRQVIGTLCTVPDPSWPDLRVRLDALEGYDPANPNAGHYLRRRWVVTTSTGTSTQAWIYLAGPTIRLPPDRLIANGDWLRRTPSTRAPSTRAPSHTPAPSQI